jgi:hypothetical protein
MEHVAAFTGWALAALLLIGSSTKLYPSRLRDDSALATMVRSPLAVKWIWRIVGAVELGEAVVLLTVGATVGGLVAAVFFLASTCYVVVGRHWGGLRPCGCFGTSHREVSWRSVARPPLLALLAATYSLGGEAIGQGLTDIWAWLWLLGTVVVVLVVSDEVWFPAKVQIARKRGRSCSRWSVEASALVDIVKGTRAWMSIARFCKTDSPSHIWREGCWQFMTFEASFDEKLATVVAAVRLPPGRATCKVFLRRGLVGQPVVSAPDERVKWPLVSQARAAKAVFSSGDSERH